MITPEEKMKILLCEDDENLGMLLREYLQAKGYDTELCPDGEAGYRAYTQNKYDLCVLDVMMPGMDGFELCKKLRDMSSNIGIMMLTAKTQEMDKVNGLLLGADDYVTKPFSPSEFTARVDALARRVAPAIDKIEKEKNSDTIVSSEFTLDCKSRTLTRNGVDIDVTQVEFQILEYFFRHQGDALSRTDILNHVWGTEYFGEEKIVDVNIRRIRKKIESDPSNPKHLLTVWGLGYKWI